MPTTDVPAAKTEFLFAGIQPNPATRSSYLVLVLPVAGEASLELFDVTGRRVLAHRWHDLAAGPSRLSVPGMDRLAPGVYSARVEHAGRRIARRVAVLQ